MVSVLASHSPCDWTRPEINAASSMQDYLTSGDWEHEIGAKACLDAFVHRNSGEVVRFGEEDTASLPNAYYKTYTAARPTTCHSVP